MVFLRRQLPKPLWYVSQRGGGIWSCFPVIMMYGIPLQFPLRSPLRLPLQLDWPLRYVSQQRRLFLLCFSFAGVKLWLNCQPGVLSWDLGHYFFGCCLVNSCGGLFRWILWLNGSPGKEHHARLVQGLSNWQVWAASPLATVCCIWSSGYTFG